MPPDKQINRDHCKPEGHGTLISPLNTIAVRISSPSFIRVSACFLLREFQTHLIFTRELSTDGTQIIWVYKLNMWHFTKHMAFHQNFDKSKVNQKHDSNFLNLIWKTYWCLKASNHVRYHTPKSFPEASDYKYSRLLPMPRFDLVVLNTLKAAITVHSQCLLLLVAALCFIPYSGHIYKDGRSIIVKVTCLNKAKVFDMKCSSAERLKVEWSLVIGFVFMFGVKIRETWSRMGNITSLAQGYYTFFM